MAAQAIGYILLAIAAAGTAHEQRKATKQQEKARKLQERIANVKAARERARLVREQTKLRAQVISQAEQQGSSVSSGTQGVQASLQTQLSSNVGFLNTIQNLQGAASQKLQSAADRQSRAGTYQAIGNFATTGLQTGMFS
jgi:hypothetical protein